MIYLKCLLSVLANNIFKYVALIFLLSAIIMSFAKKDLFSKYIIEDVRLEGPKLGFITDLDGSSLHLKNKLVILPGVKKVEIKDGKDIKKSFLGLFKDSSIADLINEDDIEYTKYIVHFDNGITVKSINLVKSYIIKILAGNEVIFSKVKSLDSKNAKFKRDRKFHQFYYFTLGVLFFVWVMLFHRVNCSAKRIAYLFQRFQRKKRIGLKVSFLLYAVNLLVSIAVCFVFLHEGNSYWLPLVPATLVFSLLQVKEFEWKES